MLIREALQLLRNEGWTKLEFVNKKNEHCMVGALIEAHRRECDICIQRFEHFEEVDNATEAIREVIMEQYPHYPLTGIAGFNDRQKTTWVEVERVMEKAAVIEEESW